MFPFEIFGEISVSTFPLSQNIILQTLKYVYTLRGNNATHDAAYSPLSGSEGHMEVKDFLIFKKQK